MALLLKVATTGLPDRKGIQYGAMPKYTSTKRYDECRVVHLCAILLNEELDRVGSVDAIIRRDGFTIPNHQYHGIDNEMTSAESDECLSFDSAMYKFMELLTKADKIISHNIDFDINVLKSELYRRGNHAAIQEIDSKELLCTMKITTDIVRAGPRGGRKGSHKYPSLYELCYYLFNEAPRLEDLRSADMNIDCLCNAVKELHTRGIIKVA